MSRDLRVPRLRRNKSSDDLVLVNKNQVSPKTPMTPESPSLRMRSDTRMAGVLGFEPKSKAPQASRISKLPHTPVMCARPLPFGTVNGLASCLGARHVAGYVSRDLVPHGDGGDVGKLRYHLLVVIEVPVESLRVPADQLEGYSLYVGGSDSSHIFHRVLATIDRLYLKLTERSVGLRPRPPAGLLAFGTGPADACRAGVLENERRDLTTEFQHLAGHLPDLPLGAAATAQRKEVEKLPGIHGDCDVGGAPVGEHVPGILVGDPQFHEPGICGPYPFHRLLVQTLRLGIGLNGVWNHKTRALHRDVALALLRERCDAVPHELMGERARGAFHGERERGVFDDR